MNLIKLFFKKNQFFNCLGLDWFGFIRHTWMYVLCDGPVASFTLLQRQSLEWSNMHRKSVLSTTRLVT